MLHSLLTSSSLSNCGKQPTLPVVTTSFTLGSVSSYPRQSQLPQSRTRSSHASSPSCCSSSSPHSAGSTSPRPAACNSFVCHLTRASAIHARGREEKNNPFCRAKSNGAKDVKRGMKQVAMPEKNNCYHHFFLMSLFRINTMEPSN